MHCFTRIHALENRSKWLPELINGAMSCTTIVLLDLESRQIPSQPESRRADRCDGEGRDAEFRRRPPQTTLTAEAGDPYLHGSTGPERAGRSLGVKPDVPAGQLSSPNPTAHPAGGWGRKPPCRTTVRSHFTMP